MPNSKPCRRCFKSQTNGRYCRECNNIRNERQRDKRQTQKELGTLPVMITVRCSPDDANMIRRQAKERGQSVNKYLVEIGRAGEV